MNNSKLKNYGWNLLIAFDQFINTILVGDPDETMSSRMGKKKRENCSICYWICRGLDVFQTDHCLKAAELDRGKRNVLK